MLSRVMRVGTTLVVLGLMTTAAVAQQPGGQRGRGGFGGRPGGMGGGATELMRLLDAAEIRKEVKLNEDGYAAVKKAQEETRASFQGLQGLFSREGSDEDRAKRRAEFEAKMKENNAKVQAVLDEVLPPEGMDRLIGLYVQLRGDSSITGELPAKKLGLSEEDKKKIDDAAFSAMREGFGRGNAEGQERGRPDAARMAEFRKKTDEAVAAQLSDAQKKALTELKGAKFEFTEELREQLRGPQGGPGQRGGPGRGNRPASNDN